MLNYSAGIQILLSACETAQIKTVFTSRKFIENAALTDLATELEKHVDVVYLEDMRTRISALAKLMGLARSYYPQLHYRLHQQDNDPNEPATILFTSGSMASAQIQWPFSLGWVVSGIISFDRNPFSSRNFGPMSRNFTFLMSFNRVGR